MKTISFYCSPSHLPTPDEQSEWRSGSLRRLHESGKIAAAQCWIYQTYLILSKAGLPVELTTTLPAQGIVVALSGSFEDRWQPPTGLFFVGIAADYHPHPQAHWHIVQNGRQARYVPHSTYIPLWPHPNLIPRDASRGDRFERAAFFGDPQNLAAEIRSHEWAASLQHLSEVEFQIRRADQWHDFHDVDCAIAIRSLDRNPHHHKPPTKLFNAWLAGVPFIGGADSAYRAERASPWDYLIATTPAELMLHIQTLKRDAGLRAKMREIAAIRSQGCSRESLALRWQRLLTEQIPLEAERWRNSPAWVRRRRLLAQKVWLAFLGRTLRFLP
ncbi:MAG: hypothetical protein SNJ52_00985 [Verrucomicrobiia bacterium]